MNPPAYPAAEVLHAICQFDTCTVANAIERFGVRLRNEGYTRPGLQCVTGGFPRAIGYAATCRVRLADPPATGGVYEDRTDWWNIIGSLPQPRIAVVQDLESPAGMAAIAGQVHAGILKAFGCQALVTNGAVRDVESVAALPFPMFARAAAVSHAYVHIVDYCKPVDIFGLTVHSGDLLLADCHGVVSIPRELAAETVKVATAIRRREERILAVCKSETFSSERLLSAIKDPA